MGSNVRAPASGAEWLDPITIGQERSSRATIPCRTLLGTFTGHGGRTAALQMRLESLSDDAPVAQVDNRRAVQLGGPARILRGAQQPALYRPRERGLLLSARTVWSLHSGSAFNEDGLCTRIIVHRPLICDGAIVLLESLQPSIESSPNVIDGHVVSALLNTSRYAANGHFWRRQAQKYDLDAADEIACGLSPLDPQRETP